MGDSESLYEKHVVLLKKWCVFAGILNKFINIDDRDLLFIELYYITIYIKGLPA